MKEFESFEEMIHYIKNTMASLMPRSEIYNIIEQTFEFGETKGYDEGEIDGYKDCLKENKLRINDERLEEEFMRGYEAGREEGEDEGHSNGLDEGYEKGREEGYREGHIDGEETGQEMGYDMGFEEGRNMGYDEGYEEGLNDTSL